MSFKENNEKGLIYMSSDIIGARHAFTTRYGGVSRGAFSSLNLGANRGDDPEAVRENYRRLCALMGVGIDGMAVTKQVHGNEVRIVTEKDRHVCMSPVPYEADGIVTNVKGLPILCMVADCVPVLLWDGEHSVAGAIHCGWRSSVGEILKNAEQGYVGSCGYGAKVTLTLTRGERLTVFKNTSDGFALAEKDLELRGSGDFLGTRQSGKFLSDIKNLRYSTDVIFTAKKLTDEAFERRLNFEAIRSAAMQKYESLKDVILN